MSAEFVKTIPIFGIIVGGAFLGLFVLLRPRTISASALWAACAAVAMAVPMAPDRLLGFFTFWLAFAACMATNMFIAPPLDAALERRFPRLREYHGHSQGA